MKPLKPLPNKQKITVAGHVVEYQHSGAGRPVIVLLNGAGMDMDAWSGLYPEITTISTVLAYNRQGVGGSDKAGRPQTAAVIVATLRDLLQSVGLPPPYLLVGHSVGGLYVNLFARQFPHDVCGIVFVDSSHPDHEERLRAHRGPLIRALNRALEGLDTLFKRNQFSEIASATATIQQVRAAGPFPNVPLVVLSGGKPLPFVPAGAFQTHQQLQRELVALSPQGRQVVAAQSGHFVQLTEPDIVLQAIRDVLGKCTGIRE